VSARVLVIDNYDSFVYNLVQYLGELGADPLVHRHDAIDLDQIDALDPDAVLISPGPGRPEDAGVSNDVLGHLGGRVPILGVCLGLQCIGAYYGGEVVRAPHVMHGKTSLVRHDGAGLGRISQPAFCGRLKTNGYRVSNGPDCRGNNALGSDHRYGLLHGKSH
jgi:anthranilate synthase/aminodeoxychorismate synthase-like glutamine amidotransferase